MFRKRIASVLSILLVLGLLAWSQWRSSRLDARAEKLQLAMSEAEVDLWLGPEAVPGRPTGTTEITGGHVAGVETAAYTKSWVDASAILSVGFDENGKVSGFWYVRTIAR